MPLKRYLHRLLFMYKYFPVKDNISAKCVCIQPIGSTAPTVDHIVSHRCQHYLFRVGNHPFRAPSRIPAFQLKCPGFFCKFCMGRAMYINYNCIILCVSPVWNLRLCINGRRLSTGQRFPVLSELRLNPCSVYTMYCSTSCTL